MKARSRIKVEREAFSRRRLTGNQSLVCELHSRLDLVEVTRLVIVTEKLYINLVVVVVVEKHSSVPFDSKLKSAEIFEIETDTFGLTGRLPLS